ncbi:MAG: hypothetical protein HY676_05450 [Chloroflexi bacterium]|nr:hypothetical protein [Chloroflexota bacterium]
MPSYDFNEAHAIAVQASPGRVFGAIKEVTPGEIPLFRALIAVRSLPALITRKRGLPFGGGPLFEQMLANGFVLLAEEPNREIVLGTVGRFWRAFGPPLKLASVQEYLAFDRSDYAKAAMNFSLAEIQGGRGVTLRTETRVCVADSMARRKFAFYWLLIKPGSGLMRREILRAVKRRAERGEPAIV